MNGLIPKLSIHQILGLIAIRNHEGSEDVSIGILQEWLSQNGDKTGSYIVWYEYGLLLLKRENFDAAQTAFKSAISEGTFFPEASLRLAEAEAARAEELDNQATPLLTPLPLTKLH